MSRSSSWRNGPRSASKTGRRPGGRESQVASRAVTPDPEGSLAEGVVLEGRIRGRLLGAPILRLDAEVVLTPARPDSAVVVPPVAPVRPLPTAGGARRAVAPAANSRSTPGSALARAQYLVDENAAQLRDLSAQP